MALENTDMLLVHLLLGAEAFLLVHFASFPYSQHRCAYIVCARLWCVCVFICVYARVLCVCVFFNVYGVCASFVCVV